jgi:hypothetical protein
MKCGQTIRKRAILCWHTAGFDRMARFLLSLERTETAVSRVAQIFMYEIE